MDSDRAFEAARKACKSNDVHALVSMCQKGLLPTPAFAETEIYDKDLFWNEEGDGDCRSWSELCLCCLVHKGVIVASDRPLREEIHKLTLLDNFRSGAPLKDIQYTVMCMVLYGTRLTPSEAEDMTNKAPPEVAENFRAVMHRLLP